MIHWSSALAEIVETARATSRIRNGSRAARAPDPLDPFDSRGSVLDHDVVACASVERVHARPAEEHVVARAAEKHVVAGTADENIVALAAVLGEANRGGCERGGLDDVVAGAALDDQPVVGRLRAGMFTTAASPSTDELDASPAT